jgi:hypothetical protein
MAQALMVRTVRARHTSLSEGMTQIPCVPGFSAKDNLKNIGMASARLC